MLETWQYLLIIIGIILLGGLLFALTGIIKVKKGYKAIIERVNEFYDIKETGFYYFPPLIYRRAGMYKIGEIKRNILVKRDEYQIIYIIEDIKKYHYIGKHDIESIIEKALKEKNIDLSSYITDRCELIGVRFISLSKIKTAS